MMEKLFGQHEIVNPTTNTSMPEHGVNDRVPASPAQSESKKVFVPIPDENTATRSRRQFLKTGFATLAAIATGSIPSPVKAQQPYVEPRPEPEAIYTEDAPETKKETPSSKKEKEEALLSKIGLKRNEVKPEFLNKYFEGVYKGIVIIDIDPKKQSLNEYDKDGNAVIRDAEICSGRKGMETPSGSYESGKRELIHVNKDDVDMPYSVAINADQGIYMHQGTLTGFPASHGCVRLRKEVSKQLYDLAQHNKDLLIVIR